jgi:hypothetical protein
MEHPMFNLYVNRSRAVSKAIMSIAFLFVCVTAQTSGQTGTDSWGDAVDGIQLRLTVTSAGDVPYERPGSSLKPVPVDLPHVECQIWNRGTAAFPVTNSIRDSQFQIDGIWYGSGPGGGSGGTLETLVPGGQSHIYALMLRNGLYELDAQMARVRSTNGDFRILELKPGKHSVRVRTGLNVGGRQVTLISNTIAIEISATPAVR